MAGQRGSRRSMWLLLFASLVVQTVEFELTEEDWEELPASLVSLHSLRGLHHQITHDAAPDTQVLHHMKTEKDIFEDLRDCKDLSECVLQKEQDFKSFLAYVEGQKLQETLLSASDLSYNYRNKILLMMDEEAETLQRAEEEHLEDPGNSVKVGQACIDKGLCLMKVHKDTVVMIFGRTTEDGSRLSDYNGISLATALLQTELKLASLFSINGNTSVSFQKNFMRVFRTNGLSAVLETNKHDYQILDHADLAVKYTPKISQRGIDHTTQYDGQSILIMEDNQAVREAATYLYEKHPAVTSMYMLDQNGSPKLIKGDPLHLSSESRLVLVGHGKKNNGGKMRLAGYQAEDVAEIVSRMNRVGGGIKTTSIVGCELGSDESFISTLLNELHARSIDTELHLRKSIMEVSHLGQKVTVELTPSGLVRRHKDDSDKVIAWRNEDGKIVTKIQSNSRGREVFSNENNFLGDGINLKTQPAEPTRCVHDDAHQPQTDILEGLAWGFFADRGGPDLIHKLKRPVILNDFEYVLMVPQENTDVRWIETRKAFEGNKGNNNQNHNNQDTGLEDVLNHCYEIKSADDVLNLIAHYANFGETENIYSYIMLHDWIFKIESRYLYVYPVGKRLNNNEKDDQNRVQEIKDSLEEQKGQHQYKNIYEAISKRGEPDYGRFARETLNGQYEMRLSSSTEAWYSTYFLASVMSESARNFRTFPIIAMALSMCDQNGRLTEEGLKFLLAEHPMTRGGTWFHPGRRGFYGSSDVLPDLREKKNVKFRQALKKLSGLIERECQVYNKWLAYLNINPGMDFNADMAANLLQHVYGNENLRNDPEILSTFTETTKQFLDAVKTQQSNQGFSGALGGSADGRVTDRDLHAYANVEHQVMLSSHYTRSSAVLSETIQVHLQKQLGKPLKDFVVKPDSIKMEDGDCFFEVVSKTNPGEKYSFKVQLPEEARQHMEHIQKSIQSISEVDVPAAGKVQMESGHLHRTGMALGVMGVLLGAQGAVRSFESGDIEHGVMGILQTAHGVTGLSTAVLGKQLLVTKNIKVFRAINTILRNPVSKSAMQVLPLVGIGFGIYSVYEDLKRGDTLGYIDAGIDSLMIALDVFELAVPVLAPIIAPLNLAISAVRMLIDDVYLSIQSELNNLPPDAGVLDKIGAIFHGLEKGFLHFALDILSFFYTIPYREIEEGRRLVQQISDYQKYFSFREVQTGRKAIDFTGGDMSMSGGGITFCLSDQGYSTFCMDNFVSSESTIGPKCWTINTDSTKDIILGIGESHRLQYSTIQLKVLLFIPAGSMDVVSGYKAISHTRYGTYKGNNLDNNFFSVQTDKDKHVMELLLSYYYKLYGKNGDDTFFLGPQRSYVEGQGGRDTYIVPSQGGSTVINNYDPVKTMDLLLLHVSYCQLSVRKSGNDVILSFLNDHNVRILNWFVGEEYRHMNIMSEDGISFDILNVVVSSVKLIARSVNLMSKTEDQVVDVSRPPLNTVINILGSPHNDELTGNSENNLIDGGEGSLDILRGKEGEDTYIIKKRANPATKAVVIENYSSDNKQDMMILDTKIHDIKVRVNDDHLILMFLADQSFFVTLLNWFRSEADRHLVILTEDFITFTFSADRSSCTRHDPFNSKCILIQVLDYTKSKHSLQVDLEGNKVYQSVTEVRGSNFDDNIKGNGQQNVIIPGKGTDFLQGRGGEDWYIVTPGTGLKTIDNYSPDLATDKLYIREKYEFIKCKCDGEDLQVLVHGTQQVLLKGWFGSIISQHLQIISSDQVTFNLPSSTAICQLITSLTNDKTFQMQMDSKMFNAMSSVMAKFDIRQSELVTPCVYDVDETHSELEVMCHATPSGLVFRSSFAGQEKFQDHGCPYADQPLFSSGSMSRKKEVYMMVCRYMLNLKYPQMVDNRLIESALPMFMNEREFVSVIELFGSSGFDEMTGNAKDNKLDPYTGGGLMVGLDGKDTYVVKSEYGTNVEIDNLSKDLREDTVLFEADFFSGLITVSSEGYNVLISAKAKGHDIQVRLLNYHLGKKHQHLSFLTSDGVHFHLGYQNEESLESLLIKAYKIKLEDKQDKTGCQIDLSAHTNLSAVHTVQGCPQQSSSIEGNGLDNALTGGVKDDAIDGGPGHDTLIGGQGNDILLGGSGDDTIYGEDGDDTMMGGPGFDVFIPGPGVDLVDGGTGRDTVFYQGDHSRGEGVYVNLLIGECRQADAEGDVLKDIENVVGTIYSDILVSGYEPALLKGSDGNDVLVSLAGQDYLIGGDGSDVYLMVFPQDTIVIDNCADDNTTDVLYLPSMSTDSVHCTQTNTSLTLSFRDEAKAFQVELRDWVSNSDTCQHLLLILREGETTVEDLTCKANAGQQQ